MWLRDIFIRKLTLISYCTYVRTVQYTFYSFKLQYLSVNDNDFDLTILLSEIPIVQTIFYTIQNIQKSS